MAAKITGNRADTRNPMTKVLWDICQRLPWERLLVTAGAAGVVASHNQSPIEAAQAVATKPGCAAADACVLVQGYLDGLSRGNGGSGVLALDKIRNALPEGALAAEKMGHNQLATEMRAVAAQLPTVRTREDATRVAQQLRPVTDRAWRLGRICGLTKRKDEGAKG